MAEGFITRRGGVAEAVERTLNPSINFVSKTQNQIVVTFTNNDSTEADVFYGITSPLTTKVTLAATTTSSNITFSGLDPNTPYTISAYAIVTDATLKKIKSEMVSTIITTDPLNPADLNPQLWLDAADATTITASNGKVSQWNNKGSLGNFTQSTSARQPTTGNSTLNGLNVIESDGDTLVAANTNEWKFLHDGTKYIFSVVFQREQDATNSILSSINSVVHRGVLISSRTENERTKAFEHFVFRGSATSPQLSVENIANNTIDLDEWYIATVIADPSNATAANRSEIFVDDGSAIKNNTDTSAVSTENPSAALTIFGFGGDSPAFKGKIAEIIVVSGANATETNRALLRDYLNDKWGVYS